MSTFEEILSKDGKLVYKTKGVSMNPMLYQNRDLVVIVPNKERLKKYDVALYRRGKSYVLHRVIEVNDDGTYLIRGDNTYSDEIVPDSAVLGVITGIHTGHERPGGQCCLFPVERADQVRPDPGGDYFGTASAVCRPRVA